MRRALLLSCLLAACAAPQPTPRGDTVTADATRPAWNEVPVTVEAAGMTVHGTLTLPAGDGRAPAILLIAGSGPTDRDWRSPLLPGTNGSAALIAHALAARGVASLRYDKRGTGATGVPTRVTWPDYDAEQRALLALLIKHPRINPARVALAGHSEGAAHALRLLTTDPATPAQRLILLAPAGRSLRDILLAQIGAQLLGAGLPESQVEAHQRGLASALDAIIAGAPNDPTASSPYPGVQQLVASLSAPDAAEFAREILAFDPVAHARAAARPTLVVCGDRDLQVDCALDATPLAQASGGQLITLPEADHVFKHQPIPRAELKPADGLLYNAADRTLALGLIDALVAFMERP